MLTPYDWQEGIGNRAQYIEGKLAQGVPVLAVSLDAGILVFTYRRQARKIYEVYDRLIFAAIGQQSDVESLRLAAVDFAHREGYNRSEEDVTIQRVVTGLSGPVKKAFSDFSVSPIVARCLFGEVGDSAESDRFYALDYDGDFRVARGSAVIAGDDALADALSERLSGLDQALDPRAATDALQKLWAEFEWSEAKLPIEDLKAEALLLSRREDRENRFETLFDEEF